MDLQVTRAIKIWHKKLCVCMYGYAMKAHGSSRVERSSCIHFVARTSDCECEYTYITERKRTGTSTSGRKFQSAASRADFVLRVNEAVEYTNAVLINERSASRVSGTTSTESVMTDE